MKLFIDPGHGLSNSKPGVYDPGACFGTFQEATLALIWAHALRNACESVGIPVEMSRHDRSDAAPVGSRVAMAKAKGCTHFVSIHLNAADTQSAHGVETLYEGTPKAAFAESIQRVLVKELGLRNRGTKWASIDLKRKLAVLAFPGPAALLELGFITNAGDREVVMNSCVMQRTCKALAERLRELAA